jgi:hypothetical protein
MIGSSICNEISGWKICFKYIMVWSEHLDGMR